MKLRLDFEGWFQCRLATNPDPTDEPRGVSGTTFALAGEPDLDRILRLQDPPAGTVRCHGPAIGVRVRRVRLDRHELAGHALVGARVALLGRPCYHSRNGIIAESGGEPIEPFHLEVRGGGIRLSRRDLLEPSRPRATVWDASPAALARRAPVRVEVRSEEVMAAIGVRDSLGFLAARARRLRSELRRTRDPVARAALGKRLQALALALKDPTSDPVITIGMRMVYRFKMNGPARVTPARPLPGPARYPGFAEQGASVLVDEPWPIEFWTGGWDGDALCGYMKGCLELPLAAARGHSAARRVSTRA